MGRSKRLGPECKKIANVAKSDKDGPEGLAALTRASEKKKSEKDKRDEKRKKTEARWALNRKKDAESAAAEAERQAEEFAAFVRSLELE